MNRNKFVLLIFIFFLIIGCNNNDLIIYKINGFTMGTTYSIKISNFDLSYKPDLKMLKINIDNELKRINKIFSTYILDSDISKFNSYKKTDWFETSEELVNLVDIALNISKQSDGYYDITVGPLVNLWGFGPKKVVKEVPKKSVIDRLLKIIGYKKIKVNKDSNQIRKEIPDIYIDLSSIAKGYGVDKVSDLLLKKGFKNFLVEIGGEVKTNGIKSERDEWLVGIASPKNGFSINKVIRLKNMSMATSGDYRNYFEKNGIRYSHTINPKTGYPIKHKLASVSVINKSCTLADAYATAIDVMGEKKGLSFANKNKLAVYMILRKNDEFIVAYSDYFKEYLQHN